MEKAYSTTRLLRFWKAKSGMCQIWLSASVMACSAGRRFRARTGISVSALSSSQRCRRDCSPSKLPSGTTEMRLASRRLGGKQTGQGGVRDGAGTAGSTAALRKGSFAPRRDGRTAGGSGGKSSGVGAGPCLHSGLLAAPPDGRKALLVVGSNTDGPLPCTQAQQAARQRSNLHRSVAATRPRARLTVGPPDPAERRPAHNRGAHSKPSGVGRAPFERKMLCLERRLQRAAPCARPEQNGGRKHRARIRPRVTARESTRELHVAPAQAFLSPRFTNCPPPFFFNHGILKAVEKQSFNLVRIRNF